MTQFVPDLPFPLFKISQQVERYMLYDIAVITWLRRAHKLLGVFVGTLSQLPQQNLFLGLPMELQPEEARLLVETGLAYTVDDLAWHSHDGISIDDAQRNELKAQLCQEGTEIAKEMERKKIIKTRRQLGKVQHQKCPQSRVSRIDTNLLEDVSESLDDSLFDNVSPQEGPVPSSSLQTKSVGLEAYSVTPVSSYSMLLPPCQNVDNGLPKADPLSYALFKHLHSLGYFITPGLRFGCQFSVYPGDPLRFHSHFLATSMAWDEEIDLLHLIGGGRLGTGVKKGWLIGGIQDHQQAEADTETRLEQKGSVRTFCIEWGGM